MPQDLPVTNADLMDLAQTLIEGDEGTEVLVQYRGGKAIVRVGEQCAVTSKETWRRALIDVMYTRAVQK